MGLFSPSLFRVSLCFFRVRLGRVFLALVSRFSLIDGGDEDDGDDDGICIFHGTITHQVKGHRCHFNDDFT